MRFHLARLCRLLLLFICLVPAGARAQAADTPSSTPATPPGAPSDLDVLMERVLKNRDQAWRRLQEYLLAERESFRLVGPDGSVMYGSDREFLWVAREGRAVRSPVRVNGVAIGDDERRREEAKWQQEEDRRAERTAAGASSDARASRGEVEGAIRTGEPRFISEVQFLRFRFEPGNYYFVGRERLAGRDVLRIEYYPRRLFSEEPDEARPQRRRDEHEDGEFDDAAFDRALNKVSLVTLWVDPEAAQVVRYTFDNVDFNFLPGRSLVRVDTARATMSMGQPFAGVWLPESLAIDGAVTLATGTYRAEYARRFSDYRQADVQMRFRVKDDK